MSALEIAKQKKKQEEEAKKREIDNLVKYERYLETEKRDLIALASKVFREFEGVNDMILSFPNPVEFLLTNKAGLVIADAVVVLRTHQFRGSDESPETDVTDYYIEWTVHNKALYKNSYCLRYKDKSFEEEFGKDMSEFV